MVLQALEGTLHGHSALKEVLDTGAVMRIGYGPTHSVQVMDESVIQEVVEVGVLGKPEVIYEFLHARCDLGWKVQFYLDGIIAWGGCADIELVGVDDWGGIAHRPRLTGKRLRWVDWTRREMPDSSTRPGLLSTCQPIGKIRGALLARERRATIPLSNGNDRRLERSEGRDPHECDGVSV